MSWPRRCFGLFSKWLQTPLGAFCLLDFVNTLRFGHISFVYALQPWGHHEVFTIRRVFYFGKQPDSMSDFQPAQSALCWLMLLVVVSINNRTVMYSPQSRAPLLVGSQTLSRTPMIRPWRNWNTVPDGVQQLGVGDMARYFCNDILDSVTKCKTT